MNRDVLFSSGKDDWGTPPDLFLALDEEFHFSLDLAADEGNALCPWWYGPGSPHAEDALAVPWFGSCFCNPPYSRGIQARFIAKAAEEARGGNVTIVMLLPARTDTRAFHAYIWDAEQHKPHPWVKSLRFLRGRIKFVGAKHGAPFPSMIVVFGHP